jgi:dihydrofolate synthase/folylpolyglutamate synthase
LSRAGSSRPTSIAATEAAAYHEAVRALTERGRFGIRLGLARTRALLRSLGDPQRSLRGALVGGTNGKGSVLALAGAALQAAGFRVGTTPKPHLVTYRERLQIDGAPIDPVTFARLVGEVLAVAGGVERRHGPPTEFELLTAMLFQWFAEEEVDLAVVEVGLGGRLDATHAWNGGVAAITNVALDHMAWLGDTIPAIAREKAAIIERGDQAVTGASGAALEVIRRRARRVGAPLLEVTPPALLGWNRDGLVVQLPRLGETRISLRGRHQAENAGVAHGVLDALGAAGIAEVPDEARRSGYASATWPGRLELLSVDSREALLDGAHNPAGAAALATALDDLRPFLLGGDAPAPPPLTLVHGSMADKDVDGIVAALGAAAALEDARIIATQVPGDRAMPATEVARRWAEARPGSRIQAIPDVGAALDAALAEAPGTIVVAGSLYLVGEARRRWLDDPTLRDPEVTGG